MKTSLNPFGFLALAVLAVSAMPLPSRADVSVEFFYDELDPYGEWIEVADYGYCWQPRDVEPEWRPYTVGEWAYTDAGWTWISEEPFGWATYHYGRWTKLSRRGWVWVPDTQWAPAWVSWRHSDRYTGWAPLPPESRVTVGVSLGGWVDAYFDVGPTAYSFVETRRLGTPRLVSVILPPRENVTIIRETRNVTNITVVNNVVINNGPDYEQISRTTERPVRKLRIERQEVAAGEKIASAKVEGDVVRVPTPRAAAKAAVSAKPRKIAQRIEQPEVDRGWREAGSEAELQPLREKMKAETKVPENLPPPKVATKPRATAPAEKDAAPPAAPGTPPPPTTPVVPDAPTPKPTPDATPSPDGSAPASQRPKKSDRPGAKPTKPEQPPKQQTDPAAPSQTDPAAPPSSVEGKSEKPRGKRVAPGNERPKAKPEPAQPSAEPAAPPAARSPAEPAEPGTPPAAKPRRDGARPKAAPEGKRPKAEPPGPVRESIPQAPAEHTRPPEPRKEQPRRERPEPAREEAQPKADAGASRPPKPTAPENAQPKREGKKPKGAKDEEEKPQ